MSEFDIDNCTAEFFEKNIYKIETTKFDDYNQWLGAVWRFKSLGIADQAIIDWCRNSSKFDLKAVKTLLNNRSKGKDDFEQCAKWFAKEAKIDLPKKEKKPFNWVSAQ